MSLAVPHVGGGITSPADTVTSDSWTSVAGSLICVIGHIYNSNGSPANGDVTDSKGNTYTLVTSRINGAAEGIAAYYNNNGTRGATHTVTFNGPGTTQTVNIDVIEITGQDVAPLDSTTFAVAGDGTTPFAVAAAAAISGNQIAIYGCTLDTNSGNPAWTQPTGYTNILNQNDGNGSLLVNIGSYKINETGTPSPAAAWAGSVNTGSEIFLTFKEAGGAPATQIVAPAADISVGGWLAEPGDGTTNLYQQIDETVLSATDYVQSSQSPVAADIYKLRIAPLQATAKPRVTGDFHFRVDHLKDIVGGDNMQLTVKLYAADGTTLIKAWTPITVTTETTADLTLTGTEADSIPDADFAVGLVLAFESLKI